MTYSEKLKDPRWQKKRLEILQRDDFTCQNCGGKNKTLHVHHKIYRANEPWDEPNANLITLCKDCHEEIQYFREHLIEGISLIHTTKKLVKIDKYFDKIGIDYV